MLDRDEMKRKAGCCFSEGLLLQSEKEHRCAVLCGEVLGSCRSWPNQGSENISPGRQNAALRCRLVKRTIIPASEPARCVPGLLRKKWWESAYCFEEGIILFLCWEPWNAVAKWRPCHLVKYSGTKIAWILGSLREILFCEASFFHFQDSCLPNFVGFSNYLTLFYWVNGGTLICGSLYTVLTSRRVDKTALKLKVSV